MISARTRAGLAAAKARGVSLGGNSDNIAGEALKGAKAGAVKLAGQGHKPCQLVFIPVIRSAQSSGASGSGRSQMC